MAARYLPQCPYCKTYLKDSDRPAYFGSPLGTCHKCRKTYIDPQTKELALGPYEPLPISKHMLRSLYTAIGSCVFPPLLLTLFLKNNFSILWALSISAAGIFLLSLGFRLLTRKSFEKRRLKEWEQSDLRLRNQTYAILLANHGYPVPPNYLPSGFKRDPQAAIYKRIKTGPFQSSAVK